MVETCKVDDVTQDYLSIYVSLSSNFDRHATQTPAILYK